MNNNSLVPKNIFQRFADLIVRLATPSAAIKDPIEYNRARTLAFVSIGTFITVMLPALVRVTFIPTPAPIRWYVYLAATVVVGVYFISRTRYYAFGVYLTVLTYSMGSVVVDLTTPGLCHATYYLMAAWNLAGIIIAGLLLSRRHFLRVIVVNVFLMSIPSIAGKVPWTWYGDLVMAFLAEAALLFGIAGAELRHASQLAESERHMRELFDSAMEALVIHDGVRILAVNPAFEKMFHCTEAQVLGHAPIEYVAPEDRDRAWEDFIMNYDKPGTHIRSTALRCDGTRFIAEATLGVVTYEGQPALVLSLRDISWRVEAEAKLRKLSRAVEASDSGILITDPKGVIEYVNPAFTRITGYTPEEVIGKTPAVLKSGKHDKKFYTQMWRTLLAGKVWRGELINRRKDGTLYWEYQTIAPVFDEKGEIVNFVAVKEDITERKEREEEMRKLQRAIEQSAHSVVITDRNGTIEYVNPAFTRVTGYTYEEAIGQNPRILKSGKHPPEFYKQMWDTILSGKVWQGELINRRKNGELYWERASIAPVFDENGEITHFVAVKEDITERKKLEDELRQANEFKTQLLGNVSHDMRTPLGAIMGYAEMLLDGAFGEVSEEQRRALTRIFQSTQQLVDFTRDLLSQAELESGRLRLNIQRFSPRELLKVVPSAEAIAEAKGVKMHTEIAPDIPEEVYGDPYWLRQIIANLLSNAVKFTEKGDIWLRIYGVEGERWAIEVEDTGIGIPPEALESIFEPFKQVDGSPTRRYKGSGLGLSIVKRLVELMHGEIRVESIPGKGSKFTVVLPCQAHLGSEEDTHA